MLYEAVWMIYALGIGICLSIGFLGLTYSSTISPRFTRALAELISILIICTGVYFTYRWNEEKGEIRALGQQVEQALQQYLGKHKK